MVAVEQITPKSTGEEEKPINDGGAEEVKENEVKNNDPVETKKESDKILENTKELKKQIKNINTLRKKYEKGKLGEKTGQYEKLMNDIRSELDATIPTIIEMNEEIDINYYMKHPKAAEKKAKEIVSNYENMGAVELVGRVIKNNKYLKEGSKQKLYKAISEFEDDINSLLNKKQKIVDANVENKDL